MLLISYISINIYLIVYFPELRSKAVTESPGEKVSPRVRAMRMYRFGCVPLFVLWFESDALQ